MTTLVARLDDIQHRLDALARRHRVPGAALAIGQGDELLDFRESFYTADDEGEMLVLFEEFDGDRPGYLFTGRAARRVASARG